MSGTQRLLIGGSLLLWAANASAQHEHHQHPQPTRPQETREQQTPEAHEHEQQAPQPKDTLEAASQEGHQGHEHEGSGDAADSGDDAPARAAATQLPADTLAMRAARAELRHHHGGQAHSMILADRVEVATGDDDEDLAIWEAQGWWGTDERRLWLKTEGAYSFEHDEFEEAELQILFAKPISAYFDLNAGVRRDFEPGSGRNFATIGVQGLAPYWFEVDTALFLSEDGDLSSRLEAEYELLFTQRLIVQLRTELGIEASNLPEFGLAAGPSSFEAGLRLRYEVRREFAPYIGVEWSRLLADTAELARAKGSDPETTYLVFGVRFWR